MPNPLIKFFAITRQEGLQRAVYRAFRKAVRPVLWWEFFILAARDLDENVTAAPVPQGFTLKKITMDDVERIGRDMGFTAERTAINRARVEHSSRGYLLENDRGEVCYMIWFSGGPAPWLGAINQMALGTGEVMVLDGITRADARGKGLHTAMFQHCLVEAFKQGFTRAYVLHLADNPPAIKIHEQKSAMRPLKNIYVFHLLGRARAFERPRRPG